MKLTEKAKQAVAKSKAFVKENSTKLVAAGTVLMLGGVVLYANHIRRDMRLRNAELEAAGKKILDVFGTTTVVEGTGPIWDRLRELFSEIDMTADEIWMVEANDIGGKRICKISSDPVMERLDI